MTGMVEMIDPPWTAQCAKGHIFLSGPKCPWCEIELLRAELATAQERAKYWKEKHDDEETSGADAKAELGTVSEKLMIAGTENAGLRAERDALLKQKVTCQTFPGVSVPCGECNTSLIGTHDLQELLSERDALLGTLKWLERWLGHKSIPECAAKIRSAITAIDAARKGET
jgi:hypothetical protein